MKNLIQTVSFILFGNVHTFITFLTYLLSYTSSLTHRRGETLYESYQEGFLCEKLKFNKAGMFASGSFLIHLPACLFVCIKVLSAVAFDFTEEHTREAFTQETLTY